MEPKFRKLFFISIVFTFIIKAFLSVSIPLTGDEAYFVLWGKHLDFGYYDHTPMIGWILHFIMYLGSSEFIIRLPAVLSTILTGVGIYFILKPYDRIKAYLISIFFLFSPINILNVLVSTDTPLIIFSFVSAWLLFLAVNRKNYLLYFLSGILLGFSFLSKYFAVLLGFAYLIYFIFSEKRKDKILGAIILFAAVIPFAFVNVYWNYTHSWANIMFNVFNRTKKEEVSFLKIILFVAVQLYMLTPPIIYYFIKKRNILAGNLKNSNLVFFAFIFIVPIALLALVSLKKVVGLHWVLSFYPFLYLLLYLYLEETELIKSIEFIMVFTLVHLILIAGVLSLPPKYFKHSKSYYEIILGVRPEAVLANIMPYKNDFILTTPSYTDSAVLSYHSGMYFPVFDGGSHHGRQDDIITDFGKFNNRNILILKKHLPEKGRYEKYFKRIEIKQFEVLGAVYYVILGYGFDFNNYRNIALKEINERYYSLPDFLPCKTDYFKEKYFPS